MNRETKDSGINWIGEIPSNWNIVKIKYLQDITQENSFVDGDWIESPYITNDGIRYLTSGNVGDGVFKRQGDGYISNTTFEELKCKYAYPNDLVISRLNAPYGRACILPEDEEKYVLAVDNVILRTEHNKKFLCYVMQCNGYHMSVEEKSAGTAMKRISRTNLGNIKLPVAPLEEQEEIVDFLDAKCEVIDQAIQKQKDIVNKLKEYKQSVITHTVTKGFTAKEKEKIDSSLSDKWQYRKIKTVVLSLTDGTHGTFKRISKGEPLLSAKNVFEEGLNITDSESMISEEDYNKITANGFPHKGDVLLCCVGTVGRTTVYPYERPLAFQRSVIFMTPNTNIITSKMLNYALMSNDVYNQENRLINQAAQAGLYQGAVREIYIYVPPLEIQDEITDFLDSKCSKINESVERSNKIIQKLEEYKKSLIYNAVTGKIDCRGEVK